MVITPLYACALTILFLALSARVVLRRRGEKISVGDQGDAVLLRRARAQGNFAEYTPIGLLLMMFAEQGGSADWQVHLIGLTLLAGRMCHAIGFGRDSETMGLRVSGMVLTFTALLVGVFFILWNWF